MSSTLKSLAQYDLSDLTDPAGVTVSIVVADWNQEITHAMLQACQETLTQVGLEKDCISVFHVPGSFELPAAARMIDDRHGPDAVICLGCVVQGETKHNEYINYAVAHGLTQLSLMRAKPFIFGLLTTSNLEQARDRSGGKHGNKGEEAAITALKMIELKRGLRESVDSIGFNKK